MCSQLMFNTKVRNTVIVSGLDTFFFSIYIGSHRSILFSSPTQFPTQLASTSCYKNPTISQFTSSNHIGFHSLSGTSILLLTISMGSDQSGKPVSLQSFRGDLQLMVTSVMNMVTKQQRETGVAVSLDRKNLLGCIESSIPQRHGYVVEVPRVDYAQGLGPFFSRLPRELRDQIFSELLISGSPHFLALSRAVNIEGTALIYKKGVYRANFEADPRNRVFVTLTGKCTTLSPEAVENIQNMSIRVNTRKIPQFAEADLFYRVVEHLKIFAPSPFTRKACSVSVELYPFLDPTTLLNMMFSLQELGRFATVLLRFDIDSTPFPGFQDRLMDCVPEKVARFRADAFKMAQTSLLEYLGPWEMGSDRHGSLLTFHSLEREEMSDSEWVAD